MSKIDEQNKERIFYLVNKHFGLDNDSTIRFKQQLFEPDIDPVYKEILGDSEDYRKRWVVDEKYLSKIDKGWTRFKSQFCSFCADNIINYHNFRNNFVLINKDRVKLRKALINYYTKHEEKLFMDFNFAEDAFDNDEELEKQLIYEIDSGIKGCNIYKLPKKKIEIVLSLNFADWFLCSTGENWSSCLNLDGNPSYWAGLPGTIVDKNLSMLYVSTGEKKEYLGIEQIDKVIGRTWVLLNNSDNLGIVGWYPHSYVEPNYLHPATKINFFEIDNFVDFSSKHRVDFLKYSNRATAYIYMDSTHFSNEWFHEGKGYGFTYFRDGVLQEEDLFHYSGGLNNLIRTGDNIVDVGDEDSCECERCGEWLHEDYIFSFNDEIMCENCYTEYVGYCEDCSSDYYLEDMTYVDSAGLMVCEDCLSNSYFTCEECNEYFYNDDSIEFESSAYCKKCIDKMEEIRICQKCGVYMNIDDLEYLITEDEYICSFCLNKELDFKQRKLNFVSKV